jgi:uncharacterized protein (DUF3084 family)
MSDQEVMPSIADVAAKFGGTAAEQTHDESSGTGGTTSAPVDTIKAAPEVEVAEVVETPAASAPKEVPKKDPQSSRFAALARREKAFREEQQKIAQKQAEIAAREKAIQDREARLQAAKKRPLDLLKEHGFQYNDALQDFMGGYKPAEEDPVDQKLRPLKEKWDQFEPNLEALKQEIQGLKTELTVKQQQESYNQAMAEIRSVASDVEKYELINAMGDDAIDLIRDTVVEFFNQHQKMLDYDEAAQIVEKYYEEEYLGRLAKTKKLQSRFPKAETSKPAATKDARAVKPTLTQDLQTSAKATVNIDDMSKQDAIAYLAKKLQFNQD